MTNLSLKLDISTKKDLWLKAKMLLVVMVSIARPWPKPGRTMAPFDYAQGDMG